MRLPKNFARVEEILASTNKKHGVTMYRHANVGNHIHMVIKIPARTRWAAYIRELTGRLAQRLQEITGDFGIPFMEEKSLEIFQKGIAVTPSPFRQHFNGSTAAR